RIATRVRAYQTVECAARLSVAGMALDDVSFQFQRGALHATREDSRIRGDLPAGNRDTRGQRARRTLLFLRAGDDDVVVGCLRSGRRLYGSVLTVSPDGLVNRAQNCNWNTVQDTHHRLYSHTIYAPSLTGARGVKMSRLI